MLIFVFITTLQLSGLADYDTYMAIHTSILKQYISFPTESPKHPPNPSPKNGVMDKGNDRKRSRKMKWNEHDYHDQERSYVTHTTVKMACTTTQFSAFPFCGPHVKSHGVWVLSKSCYIHLDPKLVRVKCATLWIPCICVACTNMLENPWYTDADCSQQHFYQPVIGCTYWSVLCTFNNWNIIQFTNKTKPKKKFDDIHKVVLDGIRDNMSSLAKTSKYGAINTVNAKKKGY